MLTQDLRSDFSRWPIRRGAPMKSTFAALCALVCLCGGILTAGCGSSGPGVTVTITSPASPQTIEAGQAVNITASVLSSGAGGPANLNWSISGLGCSGTACGTLTNQTNLSVTYNAPASVPANTTVSVVATSAAEPSQSASVGITVLAISVQIQNKVTGLAVGTAPAPNQLFFADFSASALHDPNNQGVTWTLTANTNPCSPQCGTLSLIVGNISAQYTPPATLPAMPNNAPTITATSVSDPTKSDSDTFTLFNGAITCGTGGNESELKGEYAIMLQGLVRRADLLTGQVTAGAAPVVSAGSFGADGTGKITGGEALFNLGISFTEPFLIPSASGYSVGPDNRGCLTLTDPFDNTYTFQFSLGDVTSGQATKGAITEFVAQSGTTVWASGILRRQDPSAFSLEALAPNYALGIDGWESSGLSVLNHYSLVGSFAQSEGTVSSPSFDANDGGVLASMNEPGVANLGAIQPLSLGTGMAQATLNLPSGPVSATIFVINSSELFVASDDLLTPNGVVFAGEAIATSGSLTPASIAPSYIFRSTGSSAGVASASVGLLNFSGAGASGSVSGKLDSYTVGAASNQAVSGSYAFTSASGRLAVTGANSATSPICYLANPFDDVAAFCVSTDSTASLGVMDTQPAATYGNSSLSGNFFFGSGEPGDDTVPDLSGIAAISSGSVTGTEDTSSSSGLSLGAAINAALSIDSDGTGTMGPNTVLVTNGMEIYFINEASGAPAEVQVFQQ